MNVAVIAQLLPVIAGIFLSFGQTFIKGNKKYIIAIAVYFGLKWIADKAAIEAAKNNSQVKIDPATGDPVTPAYYNPTRLAERYRLAFDPFGTGFISWNGTDTQSLFELAAITYRFEEVRTAYKTLYKSDLYDDLRSELSNSELDAFNTILNRQK